MSLFVLPDVRPSLAVNFNHPYNIDPRLTYNGSSPKLSFDQLGWQQLSAAGVPVIEYNPETGAANGISSWKTTTNEIHRSSYGSGWGFWAGGTELITNYGTGLDGSPTTLLKPNGADQPRTWAASSQAYDIGTNYVSSLFVRPIPGTVGLVRLLGSSAVYANSIATTLDATGTVSSVGDPSYWGAEKCRDGWTRLWLVGQPTVTSGSSPMLWPTGMTPTCGIEFYGMQLEKGIYPSPLITTDGSQVTRSSDTVRFPLNNVFAKHEGTIIVEYIPWGVDGTKFSWALILPGGASQNYVGIGYYSTNNSERGYYVRIGGSGPSSTSQSVGTPNQVNRVAISWKDKSMRIVANGGSVLYTNNLPENMPHPVRLDIGERGGSLLSNTSVRSFFCYPAQLQYSELQALTS